MLLYCSPVHAEAIERQTFVPKRSKHEILNRVFCAANRAEANQSFGKLYLFGETCFDRSDNAFTQIMLDRHSGVSMFGSPFRHHRLPPRHNVSRPAQFVANQCSPLGDAASAAGRRRRCIEEISAIGRARFDAASSPIPETRAATALFLTAGLAFRSQLRHGRVRGAARRCFAIDSPAL